MVVTRFHHSWSWSIKLAQFQTGDGLTGGQNDTNWVSVGIGWGIGGSCLFSYKNKERAWSPIWNWWPLFIWTWILDDFGVSVCNGPLSVMQVSWAARKFKATSYYSNHPLILSAAHMNVYECIYAAASPCPPPPPLWMGHGPPTPPCGCGAVV